MAFRTSTKLGLSSFLVASFLVASNAFLYFWFMTKAAKNPTRPLSKHLSLSSPTLMNWATLTPATYPPSSLEKHQLAKDDDYFKAVQELWKSEERTASVETSPVVYFDDSQTPLYGHVIRRAQTKKGDGSSNSQQQQQAPGILLFHTAAGPQDIFLFYKAASLVQRFDCVVMICDILSDEFGWAWGPDRSQYIKVRKELAANDSSLLASRVLAAGRTLCQSNLGVDTQRLAAMGWCLGGQPILELGRIHESSPPFSIKAMSTFHGVFHRDADDFSPQQGASTKHGEPQNAEILICNGAEDPFVSSEDLDTAKKFFRANGVKVRNSKSCWSKAWVYESCTGSK